MNKTRQTIAIAGASSGLGHALADLYTRLDHRVFGCGRRPMDTPGYRQLDIRKRDRIPDWLDAAGHVDVFIDCVGILSPKRSFINYTPEEIDAAIEVNLRAKIHLAHQTLQKMTRQGSGTYLSLASNPEGYPLEGLSLYAICKAANERLIESVAEELPSSVCALSIYPGMVDTPMLRQSLGDKAGGYPCAQEWAKENADKFLRVDPSHSGRHLQISELDKT